MTIGDSYGLAAKSEFDQSVVMPNRRHGGCAILRTSL